MHVLVTGGAGFIGAVLVPMLLERGHQVRVVDSGMFGLDHVPKEAQLIKGNILAFNRQWLKSIDAVIHLAALSNDPMAAFSPIMNYILNASGATLVAEEAKLAGIHRFIFGSTCSVYGFADDKLIDESFVPHPSFPYAISKLMAERGLACLAGDQFKVIILRKGTVVGWSPRMRFDLVTNSMVKSVIRDGKIIVHNPRLWRPLLDVLDAARAYIRALEADDSVAGTFNIAGDNYSIGVLGMVVKETLSELGISSTIETHDREDFRSYRVSTERARTILGFEPSITMPETIRRIVRGIYDSGIINLDDPKYYNIEQLKLSWATDGASVPVSVL
jgi:nucleoside-diphosphate-sugar epimerase